MKHSHLKRACLPFHHLGIVSCNKGTTFFYSATHFRCFFSQESQQAISPTLIALYFNSLQSHLLLLKEFVVEEQQIYHRHRYIGIGKVKDRPEEVVVVIDQERQKIGAAIPAEEREVEHIDHLTHHKSCVVTAKVSHRHRS